MHKALKTVFVVALIYAVSVAAEQQQQSPPEVSSAEQHVQHQPSVVVQQPPVTVVSEVVGQPPVVSGMEHHVSNVEHHPQQQQPPAAVYHYAPQTPMVSYYSPAGVIQVVGGQPSQSQSVVGVGGQQSSVVRQSVQSGQVVGGPHQYASVSSLQSNSNSAAVSGGSAAAQPEQYGQPESASIPANYKPFGSWGLYIGGNPADGYYTNYYKSLSNSVEKQLGSQSGSQSVVSGESQSSAASSSGTNKPMQSMLRQAVVGGSSSSGTPYMVGPASGADVYPFDHSYYTPADLSSAGVASRFVSPVQAGSQVYGTPSASYEPGSSMLSYADPSAYASTKRLGSSQQQVHQVQQQQKGYQARAGYVYSPVVQQASGMAVQQQQQPQVVAYPVPVGSQIVGSQPGVEGAFQPYGVHAFTRYAIKPTVVAASPVQSESPVYFPVYKQQQQQQQQSPQQQQYYSQPLSFYGYPLSQLHYSSGSVSSFFGPSSSSSSSSPVGVGSSSSSPTSSVVSQVGPVSSPVVVGAGGEQPVGGHQVVGVVHHPMVENVMVAASEKSESVSHEKPTQTTSTVTGTSSTSGTTSHSDQKHQKRA